MMKRIIILIILVIVLVSLNWFKMLRAQDLNDLSAQEKESLLRKLQSRTTTKDNPTLYQTPEIYDVAESGVAAEQSFDPTVSTGSDTVDVLQAHRQIRESGNALNEGDLMPFEDLMPFGMQLFEGGNENNTPIDISSASDYILGPGDNLIIYLWGRVESEYNLTLDREGKLFVPQVGEIVAWGLTVEKFTEKAKRQFAKVYSDFDLTVSLGKIRSIPIFVAGEVRRPGAYNVSSLTSLFNALYLAGGPNTRGSMRQIRLMRAGQAIAEVDLYRLLLEGDNSNDLRLQAGDVIFVPVAGPRVAVRGEIKRSAIYELKGEEKATELLKLAGNPTAKARLDRIQLERISQNDNWQVLDLNLDAQKPEMFTDIPLVDGDRMTVYSVFYAKTNMVAVFGRVKHPGYYERNDSTHISDLIERAQLHPYDVYYKRADLFRRYPDRRVEVLPIDIGAVIDGDARADLTLSDRDSIYIYSIDEIEWDKYVYIEGKVKNPGRFPLYDSMSVDDLIFLAGSFTRGAYRGQVEIARTDSAGNVSIVQIPTEGPDSRRILLHEDDHIYVRQLPDWQLVRQVNIDGEVTYPGTYTLASREETLYQLLQRSGGLTENAFPRGITFERASISDGLERLNVPSIIEKSTPVKEDSLGQIVEINRVDYDAQSMNRLIIDMDRILATKGREADIILEPGDRIYIPTVPSGVSVMGSVSANGTIKYVSGKNVKYYVERAGNFTRQADKKETRLIRANGEVLSGRGILGKRVDVGDVVVVPTKIDKDRNWLKAFTTALSAATGVLTSVYIISKL